MHRGAIVLCGGVSSRIGRDKALLPFGPDEVLLQRVVRLVSVVVPAERIVCVAAIEQSLPSLTSNAKVVRDSEPQRGPLAGLATGLAAIAGGADAVFVCGCDAPLLEPAFVGRMFELLGEHQIAVPRNSAGIHPLAAVYRADVLPIAESLLAGGERSLRALVERCDSRIVSAVELRDVDPQLSSLESCNTDVEYQRLQERAFLPRGSH